MDSIAVHDVTRGLRHVRRWHLRVVGWDLQKEAAEGVWGMQALRSTSPADTGAGVRMCREQEKTAPGSA